MDGGYTPGQYCRFYKEDTEDMKRSIIGYFEEKINQLNKQFEEL